VLVCVSHTHTHIAARLTSQFNNHWSQKEVTLKNKLAVEKAARKRDMKNNQSKMDIIWNFIKSQQVGSSMAPLNFSPSEDQADEDEDDTMNLDDDSHL